MELVKKNIKEIDLAGLEDSIKQYTNTTVSSIPQPDLSGYLTISNVLVVPMLPPIPGEDENPFKDCSLLVPKRYVNQSIPNLSNYATKDEIPDLSNYLTINDVYVQPQTGAVDLIVVEVVDPEGHKLITKKYLKSVVPDSSTFLTIKDTASIADTGHYIMGYDVYNHNNEINPIYYPLNTNGITDYRFKLAT
jgi:hypothetical protein